MPRQDSSPLQGFGMTIMKKILTIGWKDLLLIFRDRAALIMILVAPFLLTMGMGLVTGAFSSNDTGTGLADIPLVIFNEDAGLMGENLVALLESEGLADLLEVKTAVSIPEARRQVDDDEIAVLVIVPAGFSAGIIPDGQTGLLDEAAPIELYTSPARPISSGVVQSIVDGFANQVNTGMTAVTVSIAQLISNGLITPADINAAAQEMGAQLENGQITSPITIVRDNAAETGDNNNMMVLFAPGMALLFLMYTVTLGSRSFLTERAQGTLPRLLITPTSNAQILGGKVTGIWLTGVAQVTVLIVASSVIFGLAWGNLAWVMVLIMMTAVAATGWGLLLASFAKTPAQITSLGTTLMLVFGILGGTFLPAPDSGFLQMLSKITPHVWALDGFSILNDGGSLADILPSLLALLIMAAILFAASAFSFRRSGSLT